MSRLAKAVLAGAALTALVQLFDGAVHSAKRACIPRTECCRVCDRGKACGNSCISRSYTCHKGRGCACDLAEICE